MSRALTLVLLGVAVVLVGWVVLERSEADTEGLDALQQARAAARGARHLDVICAVAVAWKKAARVGLRDGRLSRQR
jgi:hypothetical protein